MLLKVRLREAECKWLEDFGRRAGVSTRAGSMRLAVRMLMALSAEEPKEIVTADGMDDEIQEMFNELGESERTHRRSRRVRK